MNIKKTICAALALILLTGAFAACSEPGAPDTQTEPQPADTPEETTAAPVPDTTAEEKRVLNVYVPNEAFDGCDVLKIETEGADAESVLSLLVQKGVLPEEVRVLSLEQDGKTLKLDMNEAFFLYLCRFGSSTEGIVMRCLCCTFMDAFGAESVFVTAEGQIMESGHVIYDFPITMPR